MASGTRNCIEISDTETGSSLHGYDAAQRLCYTGSIAGQWVIMNKLPITTIPRSLPLIYVATLKMYCDVDEHMACRSFSGRHDDRLLIATWMVVAQQRIDRCTTIMEPMAGIIKCSMYSDTASLKPQDTILHQLQHSHLLVVFI